MFKILQASGGNCYFVSLNPARNVTINLDRGSSNSSRLLEAPTSVRNCSSVESDVASVGQNLVTSLNVVTKHQIVIKTSTMQLNSSLLGIVLIR